LSPGTAALTFSSSNGAPPPPTANPLQVTVVEPTIQLNNFELGKDLAATITVPLPAGALPNTTFTVSTSDPGKVLLSVLNGRDGEAQVSGTASAGSIQFFAYGLDGSGASRITLSVTGYTSVSAVATLVPSGIGWINDFLSSTVQSGTTQAYMSTYALDPSTLIPIALQYTRPGITPAVRIQSDHSTVAVPTTDMVTLQPSGQTLVNLQNIGAGDAQITIQQATGFSQPASRHSLTYRVVSP